MWLRHARGPNRTKRASVRMRSKVGRRMDGMVTSTFELRRGTEVRVRVSGKVSKAGGERMSESDSQR